MVPGLSLNGTDMADVRFMLQCSIRDVLVTRHRATHDKLSAVEVKRGMHSLVHALRMLRCDAAALESVSRVIDSCISDVDRIGSLAHASELSLSSLTRLLFLRHCQRFCVAVGEPSDVVKAISKISKGNVEFEIQKNIVTRGRHDLFHGASNEKCMALLVAFCALSSILRSLGSAHTAVADACDADVLQLLVRMQLCNESVLLNVISHSHQTMSERSSAFISPLCFQ